MLRLFAGRVLPVFLCGLGAGLILAVVAVRFMLDGATIAPRMSSNGDINEGEEVEAFESALLGEVFSTAEPVLLRGGYDAGDLVSAPVAEGGLAGDATAETMEMQAFMKLSAAFQVEQYQEVLAIYQGHTWVDQATKAQRLYMQALGQLALTGQGSLGDALSAVSALIAQDPTEPSLYALQAQLLVEQGLIEQALASLSEAQQWMQTASDLALLVNVQRQVLNRHLRFMHQNRLWSEIIAFAQNPSFQQDPDFYVESQLALAQAYAALFDWDQANDALAQAALSAPGDARITAVQDRVDQLYERQQSRQVEGADSEWFSVEARRQGDSLIVPAVLGNGAYVSLLVDTGATISTLNQVVFDRVGNGVAAQRMGSRAFISASGRFEAPVILVDQLSVPPVSARNIEFALISEATPGIDGLLGMNFLKHFEFSVDVSVPELKLRLK